jgi:VanZ family protein
MGWPRHMNTQVVLEVLLRPLPLMLLLGTILVAGVAGKRLARRFGGPDIAGTLFIMSVGAAAALTSTPDTRDASYAFAPQGATAFLGRFLNFSDVIKAITSPVTGTEQVANILLFAPIGFLGFTLLRSSVKSLGIACTLTVVLETWQGYVNRSADLADVRNNILGATLGMLLGKAVALIVPRDTAAAQGTEKGATRSFLIVATGGVVVLLAFVTVPPLWYRQTQPDATADASRSGDELLDDVRAILAAQNARGVPNFSYLPQRQPPNLTRMLIAKASDPAVDSYQFGDGTTYAYVQYGRRRPHNCTAEPERGSSELCVQYKPIRPTGPSATYSYVSVRLGTSTGATPDLEDPTTRADTTYWASTDFVPLSEADWFTDLATRALAAAPDE